MRTLKSRSQFTRRSFMTRMAGAGLAAAAAPALFAGPAEAAVGRGVVGVVKPRPNGSSLVDMIKLLPNDIGVIPVFLNLQEGSRQEYGSAYATYETHIAYL